MADLVSWATGEKNRVRDSAATLLRSLLAYRRAYVMSRDFRRVTR